MARAWTGGSAAGVRLGEQRGEPGTALADLRSLLPEPPDRGGRAQAECRVTVGRRPAQDRADVVVLGGQPGEGRVAIGADQVGLERLGQVRDVGRVQAGEPVALAGRREALPRVFADRLEQPEARLAIGRVVTDEEAVVDERGDEVERVVAELAVGVADGLDRLDPRTRRRRPTAGGTGPARLRGGVVAPLDRAPQRPLALGQALAAPDDRTARRCSRRVRSAAGDSTFVRAAASSMASGSPSRRAQISATPGRSSSVTSKSGRRDPGAIDEQRDGLVLAQRSRAAAASDRSGSRSGGTG